MELKERPGHLMRPVAMQFMTFYANQAPAAGINIKPVREPGDWYWADMWLKKPFISPPEANDPRRM
ncbi:MAG: hypothetical protein AAF280_09185 [Pseudomonadota bacterium]